METVQNVVYKSSTRLAFVPDAKLQLSKFGHAQKAKFRESFAAPSSFTFCVLSSPLLLLFFPRFFFFFCWALTRLSFGGKRFRKKFEDREYLLKEVRVSSGTIFIGIFWSKLHGFLCLSPVCLTGWRSSGYGLKDLISLHKFVVKVMTSQGLQGT